MAFESHELPLNRDAHICRLKASITQIHEVYGSTVKLVDLDEDPIHPAQFLEAWSTFDNLRLQFDRQMHEVCLYAGRIWIKNLKHEDIELRICGDLSKHISQDREAFKMESECEYLERLVKYEKSWTATSTPSPTQIFVLSRLRKQSVVKMLDALLHWETTALLIIGKLETHACLKTIDAHKSRMSGAYM